MLVSDSAFLKQMIQQVPFFEMKAELSNTQHPINPLKQSVIARFLIICVDNIRTIEHLFYLSVYNSAMSTLSLSVIL